MNRETAKEFLPLVQALADGKQIQELYSSGVWLDLRDLEFCRDPDKYRVKPEPREWECILSGNDEYLLDTRSINVAGRKVIRVREILD